MSDYPKYSDEIRTLSILSVIEDNGQCAAYLYGSPPLYCIASTTRPGHLLYPDNEMSRYRPIGHAVMYYKHDEAAKHLEETKDSAWWFNIFKGVRAHGQDVGVKDADSQEPEIELWGKPWGNDMEVMLVSKAAHGRMDYNDYRIKLHNEEKNHE